MTLQVIEITDPGLRVIRAGEQILHSPGYAMVEDAQLEVGEAAFNQARIYPRKTHNQFWHRLSLDPLSQSSSQYRHYADLVYAHLKIIAEQLENTVPLIFAVPGSYTNDQLSLLLGIAKECGLKPAGLIDIALASAVVSPLKPVNYHLDIHLHQLVVTEIKTQTNLCRGNVTTAAGAGLVHLYDSWVQLVADAFLEQCRFDPLHNAETEQALYRQMPQWLEAFGTEQEMLLEIYGGDVRFQARLVKEKAVEKVRPLYQKMLLALNEISRHQEDFGILIGVRLAQLPGFCDLLNDHYVVSDLACYQGCEINEEFICRDESALSFITSLPMPENYRVEADSTQRTGDPTKRAQPTHIVCGHLAFKATHGLYLGESLRQEGIILNADKTGLSDIYGQLLCEQGQWRFKPESELPIFINGVQVSRETLLKPGDKLSAADQRQQILVVSEA